MIQERSKNRILITAIVILSIFTLAGIACSIFFFYKYHTTNTNPLPGQLEQIQSDARQQAQSDLFSDMQERLTQGTGITTLLREYFPDKIVYTDDNHYVFADIDHTLKKNIFNKEGFQISDTGEITYSEKGHIISHKGIDVSRYQGNIDFSKVKSAGVEYVMIRCGYRSYGSGLLTEDTSFKANIENALSNNLDVGVYFFTQAISVSEAIEEADFVLSLIRPYSVTYPVVLDVEEIYNDTYRQQELSKEQLTDIIIAFCDHIKKAGYTPMIYGNLKCFAGMVDLKRLENYEKWFAYYSDELYFPYEISMWQYTDSGSIDGISGNVDFNISFKKW